MDDTTKIGLAAAVAGGYVLGRTRKGRLALTVIGLVAGRKLALDPKQLLEQGARRLASHPQVSQLGDQLKGEVFEAGRSALSATADRRLAGLADSLHERTLRLGDTSRGDEDEESEEDEEEPPEDAYEDEEGEEEPRRSRRRRSSQEGGGGSGSRSAPKKPSAKKPPAKKAAAKKAAAKKTAAKKTAAKKTATKKTAAKKTTGRRR